MTKRWEKDMALPNDSTGFHRKETGRGAVLGAKTSSGELENHDLADISPPALAYLNDDAQSLDIALSQRFPSTSPVPRYDHHHAPCVFI